MHNIGEEIVGAYLQHVLGCEFVQYNLQTPDVQGEIDVIGVNILKRSLYVCESAVHLVTGLQYVRNKRPDNVPRFVAKFEKDVQYARKHFSDFTHHFMLWSPIVKSQTNAMYNQSAAVNEIKETLRKRFSIELQLVVNEEYQRCLNDLRTFAAAKSYELKSPIMRFMQIEEALKRHLLLLKKATVKQPPRAKVVKLG